jgi:GWxTD domain-containing protein
MAFDKHRMLLVLRTTILSLVLGTITPGLTSADDADSLYVLALSIPTKNNVKQAVKALEKKAKSHPRPGPIYNHIGRLHLNTNKGNEAVKVFRKAILADSKLVDGHLGLGLAYMDLKNDWKGGFRHIEMAHALDSSRVDVEYHLARLYRVSERGDPRKAAGRVVALDPEYAPGYLLLAEIYDEMNLEEPAIYYFDQYLKRKPDDQERVYQFARRLAESGRHEIAEGLLKQLNDPRSLMVLAQMMAARGQYEDAFQTFEAYLSTLSEEDQALYRDITLVGTPREMAAYQQTRPDHRQEYLRQFWLKKDPLKASGGLMRLCEHYRRVLYARDNYGKKQYPWDRRGEVYIRYGEPDYKSTSRAHNANVPQGVQIIQMELARRLYGPDGVNHTYFGPVFPVRTDRFLNVIGEESPDLDDLPRLNHESTFGRAGMAAEDTLGFYGYKPVTLGLAGMTVKWEVWFYTQIGPGIEVVFTDEFTTGRYDYAPPPSLTTDDRRRMDLIGADEELRVSRIFGEYSPATFMPRIVGATPEVYDISHYEALDFHFDSVNFRGADGQTEVRVFTGVPTRNLFVAEAGDDTARVQHRVALINERSGQVHRVQGDVHVMLGGSAALVEAFPMVVPPGDYKLAVQVWRPGTSLLGVYHVESRVPSFSADTLMVSSVQVARSVSLADSTDTSVSGTFLRSGFNVVPSPGRVFYQGVPFYVYFEIYNLAKDAFGQTQYEVAYTVKDATRGAMLIRALSGFGRMLSGGGDQESITIQYQQTGTRDWTGDYLELDMGKATAGQYKVLVTVKDLNNNRQVSKTTRFHVVALAGAGS